MGQIKGNPFSNEIVGDMFDIWAYASDMPITDGVPELAWVDTETTGLVAEREVTLEVGVILTDRAGKICRNGVADWLVWGDFVDEPRPKYVQAYMEMDQFVIDMHKKSGLIRDLNKAKQHPLSHRMHPAQVAVEAREWLTTRCGADAKFPLSGANPAAFDRGFLQNDLPALNDWFHYRSGADISSLRELAKKVNPTILMDQPKKSEMHRPIPDLLDSIKLYRYLLTKFLRTDKTTQEMF